MCLCSVISSSMCSPLGFLSMGLFRQEYWSRLPFPTPGNLPNQGIKPSSLMSPILEADSLPLCNLGSPFNKYSRLIFFRIDWLDLLEVQGTLKSSPAPQFETINSLGFSLILGPTLTSVLDTEAEAPILWANSRRQWKTEDPGVLQSMGLQRIGHDLTTKQQLYIWGLKKTFKYYLQIWKR